MRLELVSVENLAHHDRVHNSEHRWVLLEYVRRHADRPLVPNTLLHKDSSLQIETSMKRAMARYDEENNKGNNRLSLRQKYISRRYLALVLLRRCHWILAGALGRATIDFEGSARLFKVQGAYLQNNPYSQPPFRPSRLRNSNSLTIIATIIRVTIGDWDHTQRLNPNLQQQEHLRS